MRRIGSLLFDAASVHEIFPFVSERRRVITVS